MRDETAAGLDLGNNWTNVCVSWPGFPDGLVAKIPSRYANKKPPGALNKSGQRGKPQALELLMTREGGSGFSLWLGQDTLAIPSIQKQDAQKYDAAHIQILLKGVMAQWELTHKRRGVDLSKLGRLNIVASMPPSLFEDAPTFARANRAYTNAFNKSAQSHPKIRRPGMPTVQIVARFDHLVQEAVAWGEETPRDGEWVLVVDLGGGTRDWAIFNGSNTPRRKGSKNNGLMDAYEQIDDLNPALVELEILRNKKGHWPELVTWYSDVELGIQRLIRAFRYPIHRLYIIGGGASLMPENVKSSIKSLAPKVVFKDEYANCRANWVAAGGNVK